MNAIRVLAAVAIAAGTVVAVACGIDVDVSNKACPCGPGYVCDTARNVCVTPSELGDGAIILEDGAVVVPDADTTVPCPDDKCPCATDTECKDPSRTKCLTDIKTCVECLRAPNDTCPPGQYCNEQNQCTLGCKQESECQIASPAVPHCNLVSHQCVACLTPSDCPADAGLLCSPSGTCVEGCDLEAGVGCTTGKTCCGQFCLNLSNDVLNCGACDLKCSTANGTPSCSSGNCNFNSCASGFRHCQSGNTGCETNIRTTTNCGNCSTNCNNTVQQADGVFCNTGGSGSPFCSYASCKVGFGNCNGFLGDGCDCACGSFAQQICCPGNICTYPGGQCVGSNPPKCQ